MLFARLLSCFLRFDTDYILAIYVCLRGLFTGFAIHFVLVILLSLLLCILDLHVLLVFCWLLVALSLHNFSVASVLLDRLHLLSRVSMTGPAPLCCLWQNLFLFQISIRRRLLLLVEHAHSSCLHYVRLLTPGNNERRICKCLQFQCRLSLFVHLLLLLVLALHLNLFSLVQLTHKLLQLVFGAPASDGAYAGELLESLLSIYFVKGFVHCHKDALVVSALVRARSLLLVRHCTSTNGVLVLVLAS